jgi:hypothetical protein
MAKLTLLEMTQDIMSDMSDDDVTSIDDTIESLQVAQIIKSTYFELMGRRNWPHLRTLQTLTEVADTDTPTHMTIPALTKEIEWVKYDVAKSGETRTKFTTIKYLPPDKFLATVNNYNDDNSNVDTITDPSGVIFNIKNDVAPTYWTSFDDEYIVFNSYDSDVETYLATAKTQTSAFVEPSWSMTDAHTPDMPSEMFPTLLAEAKSTCFLRLKDVLDRKAEQQSKRGMTWLAAKAGRAEGGLRGPNYGRRGN